MGGGDFLWFARALQPEPEERKACGERPALQGWMFFHLQSTLKVSFSEQNADSCWRGFRWVLVVKQVCLYSLISCLRFTCYYCFSLQFLLVLPPERFCFHLSQGYILCSRGRTQLAEGGLSVLSTTFLATPLYAVTCQALLDEMKKLLFVNQLLV